MTQGRACGSTTSQRGTSWNNGALKRYIDELTVTGLTSEPSIFDDAIKNSVY